LDQPAVRPGWAVTATAARKDLKNAPRITI
jgi:hypothetical protein